MWNEKIMREREEKVVRKRERVSECEREIEK